jgi:hypothetical protein
VVRYLVHNAKVPAGLMSCAVLPPASADKRAVMSGVIFEIKAKTR